MTARRKEDRDRRSRAVPSAQPKTAPGASVPARRVPRAAAVLIGLAIVIGTILRLYLLPAQILVDDEWHSIDYTIISTFAYLWTHVSMDATSIPLNLYHRFLMDSAGWSEIALRMPSIASGILGLAIFPLLAGRIFNRRVTVLFAVLLAISPFLILTSRVSRPYGLLAFLSLLSVLTACLWMLEGKKQYALTYAVASVMAVYVHVSALMSVLAPYVVAVALKASETRRPGDAPAARVTIVPDLRTLLWTGLAMLGVWGILLLPALLNSWKEWSTTLHSELTQDSLGEFAHVLAGTPNSALTLLFWGLTLTGFFVVWKKTPGIGLFLGSTGIAHILAIVLVRPAYMDDALGISQYCIAMFPISFLLAATGLDTVCDRIEIVTPEKGRTAANVLTGGAAAIFLAALFWTGPLKRIYVSPNNFTNHTFYQISYRPLNWESTTADFGSDLLSKGDAISGFYFTLESDPGSYSIIEYPMVIGDHYNFFFYYQHFHRKNVFAGYMTQMDVEGLVRPRGRVYGDWPIDAVFSRRYYDVTNLNFRNMIDILNVDAVRRTRARYLILHKILRGETYGPVQFLAGYFSPHFGKPVFEDYLVVVFQIG